MSILVMKFGGKSLKNFENIKNAAFIIKKRRKKFKKIVVVASAIGNMTDKLLKLAKKISSTPPKREQDMLISAGERISMSLLAMTLLEDNIDAISFTGSQAGIITTQDHFNAKIIDVKPQRILFSLQENKVVIVAGFQGVSLKKEVTTLGRGGSDTTAVALACALNADKVEFYKDVDGFYDKDPKEFKKAKKFSNISYIDALSYIRNERNILHKRAILLAAQNGIVLHLLSYKNFLEKGSFIRDEKIKKQSIKSVYENF